MARPGIRSTPETTGRGGQPRRFSTAARRFPRSVAPAGAAAAGPRHSAHSRIAMRSRRRSARWHSCWRRCSTDRRASRSDKPVARKHSRIRDPARMRVHGKVQVAFGMWLATRSCGRGRAARSSREVLRCGQQAHAPGDRRELDAPANMNQSRAAASAARMDG